MKEALKNFDFISNPFTLYLKDEIFQINRKSKKEGSYFCTNYDIYGFLLYDIVTKKHLIIPWTSIVKLEF